MALLLTKLTRFYRRHSIKFKAGTYQPYKVSQSQLLWCYCTYNYQHLNIYSSIKLKLSSCHLYTIWRTKAKLAIQFVFVSHLVLKDL